MSHKILIAGGSGLLGMALTRTLKQTGYTVAHLSRSSTGANDGILRYTWDPGKGLIDTGAFENCYAIINLSGTNVGEGRWTSARKKEIIDSRIQSTQLLVNHLNKSPGTVKKFISASASGFYGHGDHTRLFDEEAPPGKDFLAQVCQQWEAEAHALQTIPLTIIRIGVVLSMHGGALAPMLKTIRLGVGSPIGSGEQLVPWIHEEDLVNIFITSLKTPSFAGTYNAASPNPVTNTELMLAIGKAAGKPVWKWHVPSFILKTMMGEQSEIVLEGCQISSQKILNTGFRFSFPHIETALENLIKKS